MKILIRNLNDPFSYNSVSCSASNLGGINVIDLANVWSCSFIETEDVGRLVEQSVALSICNNLPPNSTAFTVEGRMKDSERRGCNMLIE